MSDGYVGVATDGDGKKVDTSELIRADSTTVERQRVALGDASLPDAFARIAASRELAVTAPVLEEILGQLKRIARLLEVMTGAEISLEDSA